MRARSCRDVTVGDLLAELSRALPDREALVYAGGPRYTFDELHRETNTIARGLMAVGVQRGDRVVLWATNVPEWIVLQFALARIGAVLVTANTLLRPREIDYLVRQSEASTIVTMSGFRDLDYVTSLRESDAVTGPGSFVKRLVYIGQEPPPGFMPYSALREAAGQVTEAELAARASTVGVDDVVNMQYTSGTTGFPKGVMLSSRNIVNNGEALGAQLAFTPADRLCLCVPLFHCFGCVIGVLGAYTHGVCLCPIESFDPRKVLETVQRERCTALYGVPTMFLAELECPDFASFDLTSLRTGVMAGALCPEPLMRRVITEMHLPEITIAYGMTESSPGITITPRDAPIPERSQTVGCVLPEMDVKIVDPLSGAERACGESGELCCRGYNVMKGYYNNPDATRTAIDADGWLHTGDEASRDANGYIRITGRIKDLIIRGGENIAPKEIEDRLREHPSVADAYVYAVPDAFFGEAVAAAVRLSPDAATRLPADAVALGAELTAWCTAALAKFKVPRDVRFVSAFPMTASGKIQKFKLRENHSADFSTASAASGTKAPDTRQAAPGTVHQAPGTR
jgi:fatty-acyl-CoA synthase